MAVSPDVICSNYSENLYLLLLILHESPSQSRQLDQRGAFLYGKKLYVVRNINAVLIPF